MAQLYFYYSAMNAGKSTALLQSSYNYQERGMRTVVYTAEIDDRFGAGKVSSRIGLSSPALISQSRPLFSCLRADVQLHQMIAFTQFSDLFILRSLSERDHPVAVFSRQAPGI